MKKYLIKSVFPVVFALMFVFFSACRAGGYVCEKPREDAPVSITEKTELVKTIGDTEYALRLVKSYISSMTGRTIDVYETIASDASVGGGIVKLDRETGELLSFAGDACAPYASFGALSDWTEAQIKSAVEAMLAEDYDFSVYNQFTHDWSPVQGEHILTWSVEMQNISLTVQLSESGEIVAISKIDAGTDASDVLALSEARRDELILKCLKTEGAIDSVKNMTVEIVSAKQSTYQEHDAVIYTARVRDAEGFVSLHVLAIYKD